MDKRNEELLEEKGLMIEMDAEIAKVFKESTKVSCRYRLSFIFLLFAALVPRPAYYQLPVEGPDHPARPAQGFWWRMMPVAADMFRSSDAES